MWRHHTSIQIVQKTCCQETSHTATLYSWVETCLLTLPYYLHNKCHWSFITAGACHVQSPAGNLVLSRQQSGVLRHPMYHLPWQATGRSLHVTLWYYWLLQAYRHVCRVHLEVIVQSGPARYSTVLQQRRSAQEDL